MLHHSLRVTWMIGSLLYSGIFHWHPCTHVFRCLLFASHIMLHQNYYFTFRRSPQVTRIQTWLHISLVLWVMAIVRDHPTMTAQDCSRISALSLVPILVGPMVVGQAPCVRSNWDPFLILQMRVRWCVEHGMSGNKGVRD